MTLIEKIMSATFVTIGIALILTNPQGTRQAGDSAGSLYKSIVGAFVRPS